MKRNKINMVVDGQWGSCGKGLLSGYLCEKFGASVASSNNMPNAGHTAYISGVKVVSKALPVGAYVPGTRVLLGAGAAFSLDRLAEELEQSGARSRTYIHPRAIVVSSRHAEAERGELARIASTMQGCAAAACDKLMRKTGVIAGECEQISDMVSTDWRSLIIDSQRDEYWLHEGSQGFSLGINSGSHYPQCTSRECTPTRELSDMCAPAKMLGDVYLVVRSYPIRVGNFCGNSSGGAYSGQNEITWEEVSRRCGGPVSPELTTVTGRIRRVFEFSAEQVRLAAWTTGATKIFLNFANYIDSAASPSNPTNKVMDFASMVEDACGVPVFAVGFGPRPGDILELEDRR